MSLKSVIFVLLVFALKTQCANILGVFPVKFKSHYIVFQSVMVELTRRGHNVTVLNSFPRSKPTPNFTDIDTSSCSELLDMYSLDVAYNRRKSFRHIPIFTSMIYTYIPIVECDVIQNFLEHINNTKYDLVITELFNNDLMLGFVYKLNIPSAMFCAGPIFPWGGDYTGNPNNPSYIPYPQTDEEFDRHKPTFYQRLYNTILYIMAKTLYSYYSYMVGNSAVKKFIGSEIPALSELAKNTSLILTFSHFSINTIQPMVPNVVEVAGLQIGPKKPLPEEIQKFIDESEHGVIYFCMGSLLKSETMPDRVRLAFLDAFSKIPQRVIWKWGDDHLPGKTSNIFTAKWMPQRDILAHPKVKLFIAHGGALGLNEAIYEGVPVLGIPMYGDQGLNLQNLRDNGAAEILHYLDINNHTVYSKIHQILTGEYVKNMKKISQIYKDRPLSPMDTAVYWIEYVIRHKGARHIRSAAVDLPLYQYLLLDVIGFTLISIISTIFILRYILRKTLQLCIRNSLSRSKKNN